MHRARAAGDGLPLLRVLQIPAPRSSQKLISEIQNSHYRVTLFLNVYPVVMKYFFERYVCIL